MRPLILTFLALLFPLGALCSCGDTVDSGAAGAIEEAVYTGFHPTAWMAQTIASGAVPVVCLLPEGADAIFWKPGREALARYQSARLIVSNGAELEKWMARASLPRSRVVDSAASFEDRFLTFETTTHSHGGSEGEHTHDGVDGHTWLDPKLAVEQARAIAQAMKAAWPEHEGAFDGGLQEVVSACASLEASLSSLTPKLAEFTVLASHPAYDYLARGMGWKIDNLDLDPAAPLKTGHHLELASKLRDAGEKRLILWESAPLPETVRLLEEKYALRSVVFSPGENVAGGFGRYGAEMSANVERLAAALR